MLHPALRAGRRRAVGPDPGPPARPLQAVRLGVGAPSGGPTSTGSGSLTTGAPVLAWAATRRAAGSRWLRWRGWLRRRKPRCRRRDRRCVGRLDHLSADRVAVPRHVHPRRPRSSAGSTTNAPLLGNGDVGVAILNNVDTWRSSSTERVLVARRSEVKAMVRMALAIPSMAGASYS